MLLTILKYIFYFCLVIITYLALTPIDHAFVPHWSDKINHVLAFLTLSFMADASHKRSNPTVIVGSLLAYGIAIELVQGFIPGRYPSLADVVADGISLLLYFSISTRMTHYAQIKSRLQTLKVFGK